MTLFAETDRYVEGFEDTVESVPKNRKTRYGTFESETVVSVNLTPSRILSVSWLVQCHNFATLNEGAWQRSVVPTDFKPAPVDTTCTTCAESYPGFTKVILYVPAPRFWIAQAPVASVDALNDVPSMDTLTPSRFGGCAPFASTNATV